MIDVMEIIGCLLMLGVWGTVVEHLWRHPDTWSTRLHIAFGVFFVELLAFWLVLKAVSVVTQ